MPIGQQQFVAPIDTVSPVTVAVTTGETVSIGAETVAVMSPGCVTAATVTLPGDITATVSVILTLFHL